MFAEDGYELGGERDGGSVFEQERAAIDELDDEAESERAREVNFDEAHVVQVRRRDGAVRDSDIPARMRGGRRMDRGWVV